MKKTILIVDDFANTLFVTGYTLEQFGYNVLKAQSGQEALSLLDGQQIDLIISDYNMPEMNGIEFIEKAKTNSQYKNTPVFILSTEINANIKKSAYATGITAWIAKPFNFETLKKQIAKILA